MAKKKTEGWNLPCKFCQQDLSRHGEERLECPNGKRTTFQTAPMSNGDAKRATRKGWLREET